MNIIVAVCRNQGIGFKNTLPWKLKKELKYFKFLTKGNGNNAVIMGKNTCFSLPRALPKRENFVLSSTMEQTNKDFNIIKNINSLKIKNYNDVWIIGGAQFYKSMINNKLLKTIYYTDIDADFECDTFFPEIPSYFKEVFKSKDYEENEIKYNMKIFINDYYLKGLTNQEYHKYINKAQTALHYTNLTL